MLDASEARSSSVKNPFCFAKTPRARVFCLERLGFASGKHRFRHSVAMLTPIGAIVITAFLAGIPMQAQASHTDDDCKRRVIKKLSDWEPAAEFGQYSEVAEIVRQVKASEIGQALSACPA